MRLNNFSLYGRQLKAPSQSQPWICSDCVSSPIRAEARRGYSRLRQAKAARLGGSRQVNKIFLAVATVGIAGSAYLLRDDIRHWYIAAQRSGRVVSTLYVNIQEYVVG